MHRDGTPDNDARHSSVTLQDSKGSRNLAAKVVKTTNDRANNYKDILYVAVFIEFKMLAGLLL